MKIQRYIDKNNRRYTLVKIYKNFIMYEDEHGVKECFSRHELGLLKEQLKPSKSDINPEKVIFCWEE